MIKADFRSFDQSLIRAERWNGLSDVLESRRPFCAVELPARVTAAAEGLAVDFGQVEPSRIALARQLGVPLLMDDLPARLHAESLGVKVAGTLKVLALCKERRLTSEEEAHGVLNRAV